MLMENFSPIDAKILLLLTGIAWSALIALAKRSINSVEKKIDDNAKAVATLQSRMATMIGDTKYRIERNFRDILEDSRTDIEELSKRFEGRAVERRREIEKLNAEQAEKIEALRLHTVSRGEFALLSTNLHLKIEAIYNHLISNDNRS